MRQLCFFIFFLFTDLICCAFSFHLPAFSFVFLKKSCPMSSPPRPPHPNPVSPLSPANLTSTCTGCGCCFCFCICDVLTVKTSHIPTSCNRSRMRQCLYSTRVRTKKKKKLLKCSVVGGRKPRHTTLHLNCICVCHIRRFPSVIKKKQYFK